MTHKMNSKIIKETLSTMAKGFNEELFAKKQEELESYWHFNFDSKTYVGLSNDLYDFYKALRLYESFCRRWEEHHNGSCCVVERVRDTYLMPKIKQFLERGMDT